jgi:hypothetical protein
MVFMYIVEPSIKNSMHLAMIQRKKYKGVLLDLQFVLFLFLSSFE